MDHNFKKIFVIGHPCLDIIHKGDEEFEEIGGIIYSLLGFYLINSSSEIIPVFNLDESIYEKYYRELEKLNLNLKYIKKQNEDINRVHLFFENDKLLFECYQKKAEKINVDRINIDEISNSDIYINMISGFELELNDLKKLRQKCRGKIYFDFHTLTRGYSSEGKRFFRPLNDWKEWIKCCDIIQLNESERINLTSEKLSEEEFATECLNLGCKVVNITKSEQGAISYFANSESIIIKPNIDFEIKSVVGCGDIFGAIYFYYFISDNPIEFCIKKAVEKSTLRTKYFSIKELIENKKEFIDE